MDDDEIRQFRFDYYNGSFAKAGLKPKFVERMKYKFGSFFYGLVGLIAIGIIYLVINFVLVGAQDLWHGGDKGKLNEIKAYLEQTSLTLDDYERDINDGGISDSEYNRYSDLVEQYNNKVNEYNTLAEKVGTTYYIVPGIRGK